MAVVHHDDGVGHFLDLSQGVGGQEDSAALLRELAQQLPQPDDPVGIEAVHRFVQDEELRLPEKRESDSETLLHSQREGPDTTPQRLPQTHLLQEFPPLVLRDAVGRGQRLHSGHGGQFLENALSIDEGPECCQWIGEITDALAVDGTASTVGFFHAGDHPQRGGFAGSVGPHEADDLAGMDRQGNVCDGLDAGIGL